MQARTMAFEGISALFQRLIANLQLTSDQVADASGKHQRVRRALNSWYYSTESGTANSMLIGSYGKDTEIRSGARPRSLLSVLSRSGLFDRAAGHPGLVPGSCGRLAIG